MWLTAGQALATATQLGMGLLTQGLQKNGSRLLSPLAQPPKLLCHMNDTLGGYFTRTVTTHAVCDHQQPCIRHRIVQADQLILLGGSTTPRTSGGYPRH